MAEIGHLLEKDRTTGTKRYVGVDAMLQAVVWWIHTPRGSQRNRPDYGHEFEKFQNESMTTDVLQDIEYGTFAGIKRDLGLDVLAVYATPTQEEATCDIRIVITDNFNLGMVGDRVK